MQRYRRGHNGMDSKTFKYLRNENAEKPLTLRFSGITSLLKHPPVLTGILIKLNIALTS